VNDIYIELCPMMVLGEVIRAGINEDNYDKGNCECKFDNCGWYDDDAHRCCIMSIAAELRKLNKKKG
jgi:hypothetical protein